MPRPSKRPTKPVSGLANFNQAIISSVTNAIAGVLPSILDKCYAPALEPATNGSLGASDLGMTIEFTVSCKDVSWARLGMHASEHHSGNLVVNYLHPGGALAEWNAAVPRHAVQSGDLICAVNGVTRNPHSMLLQLESGGDLQMRVRRYVEDDTPGLLAPPPWQRVLEQLGPLAAGQHRIEVAAEQHGKAIEQLMEAQRRVEERLVFLSVGQRYLAEQLQKKDSAEEVALAAIRKDSRAPQHSVASTELANAQRSAEEKLLVLADRQRHLASDSQISKVVEAANTHDEICHEAEIVEAEAYVGSTCFAAVARGDGDLAPAELCTAPSKSGACIDDIGALLPALLAGSDFGSRPEERPSALEHQGDAAAGTLHENRVYEAGGFSCGPNVSAFTCHDSGALGVDRSLIDEVTPDMARIVLELSRDAAQAASTPQNPDMFGAVARPKQPTSESQPTLWANGQVSRSVPPGECAPALFGGRLIHSSRRASEPQAAETKQVSDALAPQSTASDDASTESAHGSEGACDGHVPDTLSAQVAAVVPSSAATHPLLVERHGRKNPRFEDASVLGRIQAEDTTKPAMSTQSKLEGTKGAIHMKLAVSDAVSRSTGARSMPTIDLGPGDAAAACHAKDGDGDPVPTSISPTTVTISTLPIE